MAKKYDLVAITGTYTDGQGNEKKRYMTCGAVFEKDGKFSLKLEGLPVGGDWNGWFGLFDPKERNQASYGSSHQPAQSQQPQQNHGGFPSHGGQQSNGKPDPFLQDGEPADDLPF